MARRAASMPQVGSQFIFTASVSACLAQPALPVVGSGTASGMLDEKWAKWQAEVLARPVSKREVNA